MSKILFNCPKCDYEAEDFSFNFDFKTNWLSAICPNCNEEEFITIFEKGGRDA